MRRRQALARLSISCRLQLRCSSLCFSMLIHGTVGLFEEGQLAIIRGPPPSSLRIPLRLAARVVATHINATFGKAIKLPSDVMFGDLQLAKRELELPPPPPPPPPPSPPSFIHVAPPLANVPPSAERANGANPVVRVGTPKMLPF